MPYSDAELEQLYGDLAPTKAYGTTMPEAEVPEEAPEEVRFKRLKQIANIIPKAIGSTAGSINALLNPGTDLAKQSEDFIPSFDVGQSKGIPDMLLNEAAPAIASWMIPYLGATKIGKAAGMLNEGRAAAGMLEAAAQGGANAFTSLNHPDAEPVREGALGAASGFVQATLPRFQRILPLAAISGINMLAGGDAFESGANLIGNLIPGAHSVTVPKFNPKNFDEVAASLLPHDPNLVPADLSPYHPSGELRGTLSFMDQVQPNRAIGDSGVLSPFDDLTRAKTTIGPDRYNAGDVQDAFIPHFQETTLSQLNELKLNREPVQMDLNLQEPAERTGLYLDHNFPIEGEVSARIPNNDPSLRLEGQTLSQPDLHPLITLQGERIAPIHSVQNPGEFRFVNTLDATQPNIHTPEGLLFEPPKSAIPHPSEQLDLALTKKAEPVVAQKPTTPSPSVETPVVPKAKAAKIEKRAAAAKQKVEVIEETPHEKAMNRIDEIELDPEANKNHVLRHAEKMEKQGFISKDALAEIKRIAKDKDMGVEDLTSELKSYAAPKEMKAPAKVEEPLEVMTAEGFHSLEPKMEGPHIISSLVKDNDTGALFAGKDWKNTHNQVKAQDPEGLLMTKFDLPGEAGEAEHMFLVKDENGVVRSANREEAARIVDISGQRDVEYKGLPLQSEHLKDVTPLAPKTPEAVKATEKVKDVQALATTKKSTSKLTQLMIDLDAAKFAAKEGEEGADIEVRTIRAAIEKLRKGQQAEAGAISPELAAVLAVGGVGSLVAYQQSKGDIGTTLAVGLLAAGLGVAGVRAMKGLSSSVGEATAHTGPKVKVDEGLIAKGRRLAKETAVTPTGNAVFGRGGIQANVLRMTEGLMGNNPMFRDAKIVADGFVAHQLEKLTAALESAKAFKPSDGFADAAQRFIRGQLVEKPIVEATIKSGGGMDSAAFNKLDKAAKKAYPEKWLVIDNPNSTNTSGPGTEVWHVSNATKTKLMEMQKDALRTLATTKADKEWMQFPMQSREILDSLMQVVHNALPEGSAVKNKVMGTMGQYAARTHALLTDPKYYPTDVEIGRAMDRLAVIKEDRFLEKYASAVSKPGTVPITYKGTTHYVSTAAADEWKHLHTPEALRSLVSQYIHEIKQVAAGKVEKLISKDTEQLGSSLFARRKELDEVTQVLLGTHTSPMELIQHTANKLIPSTRSAHFMSDLVQMKDAKTGLQHAYTSEVSYNKAVNEIKHLLNSGTKSPVEIRALEDQLKELSSYIPISGQSPRMGLFEGSYASRTAHDQLAGFTNPFGMLDNTVGHWMSHFNQVVKDTHLVANPIVHVRNAIQVPMFLAIGNAAAHPEAWKGAWEAMRNPLSKIGKRLTENGVFSGNVVHGEFNHSMHELLSGEADKNIWETLKKVRNFSHKAYGVPDNFVRAAVYLAEESRAAKRLGVDINAAHPSPADAKLIKQAQQEARLFMSRRTMDYANVPQIVKTGRQLPFVSMFLSYTSEIMRIGRNLTMDALKGDLTAGATLGGLASLPFLAQSHAENQLSPADRKAWDKTQNVVQDYSRVRFKMPLSRNKDGSFNYLDLTPLMPFNDFQMSARAVARGDTGALAAINPFVGVEKTPLLSTFAEQITGKEIHSGKEFRGIGDRAWAIAKELLPPWTPGIGNDYEKDFPESWGGSLGVTNMRNGRTNTIEGTLSRHIVGMDYTQINPSIAMKNYVAAAKRDIANERQYYMDVMLSQGVSADAKKRASEKFVESVNVITGQLQSRLQLTH